MLCRMFSSISGLYLRDTSSTSNPSLHSKISPDIPKCPWGWRWGASFSQDGTHCSVCLLEVHYSGGKDYHPEALLSLHIQFLTFSQRKKKQDRQRETGQSRQEWGCQVFEGASTFLSRSAVHWSQRLQITITPISSH